MLKAIVTKLTLDGKEFQKGISESQKQMLGVGAVATGLATAIGAVVTKMAGYQDAMTKSARTAGVATKEFSGLAWAAEQSGLSQDDLAKSMARLTDSSDAAQKRFAGLGIAATDVNGKMKSSSQLLGEVADKVQAAQSPSEKTAIAIQALGKRGGEMVSLLAGGSKGLADMTAEAERLGLTVDDVAGEQAEIFNDSINRMGNSVKGVANTFSASVVKMVNSSGLFDAITDTIAGLTGWWKSLDESTRDTIVTVGAVVTGIGMLVGVFGAIMALSGPIMAAISGIGAAIAVLTSPISLVIAAVGALVYAFYEYWDQIKSSADPVVQSLSSAFNDIKRTIVDVFDAIKGVIRPIIDAVADVVAPFLKLEDAVGDTRGEIDYLGTAVKTVFNIILTAVQLAVSGIGILIGVWRTLSEAIIAVGSAIVYAFSGEWKKASRAAKAAYGSISSGIDDIKEKSIDLGEKISKIWEDPVVLKVETTRATKEVKKTEEAAKNFGRTASTVTKKAIDDTGQLEKAWEEMQARLDGTAGAKSNAGVGIAKMVNAATADISQLTNAAAMMTGAIADGMAAAQARVERDQEVTMMRMEDRHKQTLEAATSEEEAAFEKFKKQKELELAAFKSTEEKKTLSIKAQAALRIAEANAEFQAKKAAADAEFQARVESERIAFEAHKALVAEQTVFKEERMAADSKLEADWLSYLAKLQDDHDAQMVDMAKEYSDTTKGIDDDIKITLQESKTTFDEEYKAKEKAANNAIIEAEKKKNNRLKNLEERQNDEKEKLRKKQILQNWKAQVAQFEATKATNIATTIASGISAAAQAFAALAPIPFVGIGLGLAAAATITAAMGKQVANIEKQKPLKPAELIAAEGGLIPGNRTHARGGVDVNAESGEIIIDRPRSNRILDSIENKVTGGTATAPNMNFYINQQMGEDSEALAERVADMVARRFAMTGAYGR